MLFWVTTGLPAMLVAISIQLADQLDSAVAPVRHLCAKVPVPVRTKSSSRPSAAIATTGSLEKLPPSDCQLLHPLGWVASCQLCKMAPSLRRANISSRPSLLRAAAGAPTPTPLLTCSQYSAPEAGPLGTAKTRKTMARSWSAFGAKRNGNRGIASPLLRESGPFEGSGRPFPSS